MKKTILAITLAAITTMASAESYINEHTFLCDSNENATKSLLMFWTNRRDELMRMKEEGVCWFPTKEYTVIRKPRLGDGFLLIEILDDNGESLGHAHAVFINKVLER